MMEWWNDIRMLCARYLVASEAMDRGGPIEAAVRSVGYETEEEETEGSSVEEEEDDGLYDDARDAVQEDRVTEPPGYGDHDEAMHGYGVGYGDEKKVSRRPSKRQQEKAPEGKGPHLDGHKSGVNGAGPAPAESKFHEDI